LLSCLISIGHFWGAGGGLNALRSLGFTQGYPHPIAIG
jgi:hypothetical protein